MTDQGLYVGIDAGGTRTTVRVQTPHGVIEREAPGLNPQVHGAKAVARRLVVLLQEIAATYPEWPLRRVCIGLAGGRTAELQQQLREHLARHFPTATFRIMDDALLALQAAFEGKSGYLILAGTGSNLLAGTVQGEVLRAGGWGYLLGDEAGGYRLGLAGLQALADMLDGGPSTRLAEVFTQRCGSFNRDVLIREVYHRGISPATWAPDVLKAAATGDVPCQEALEAQVTHLLDRLAWLRALPAAHVEPRVALWGGLFKHPHYRTTLVDQLRARFADLQIVPMAHTPVAWALHLARKHEES